ncbi:MAG: glycosyl hydrolase family 18 protein [Cellulosilyticaceae bacterium]
MKKMVKKLSIALLSMSLGLGVGIIPNTVLANTTGNEVATEIILNTAAIQPWDASKIYNKGDRVTYNGQTFEAKWWIQGEKPDASNEWGPWGLIEGPVEPPKETVIAPSHFNAVAQNENSIIISWEAIDGISEYELMLDGQMIRTTAITYTHENLQEGTNHVYKVRVAPVTPSIDYLWSNEVTAKTLSTSTSEEISAPTNLRAVNNGQNEINIFWDGVAKAKEYELMVDGSIFKVAGTNYKHTGLLAASIHTYKVRVAPTKPDGKYLWSEEITAKTENEPPKPGEVAQKLLVGYWHNFDNGSSNMRLKDIPKEWDVVQVAFGETSTDRAIIEFKPYNCKDEEFKQDIQYLNNRGVKVILSIGGQNGVVHIDSPADVDKFVNSVSKIIDRYGFNGLDIDVENGISVTSADKNLKNPSTPRIKYTVQAINKICEKYGKGFWLTMAPEIAYVQGGIVAFNGPWGAYLPIIDGVRDHLTMIHVQHYNCADNPALDGRTYKSGTADFQVAMTEMLLQGFNVAGDANTFFAPLRPDQVGIGIPAKPIAAPSGGYISPTEMQKALDYIIYGKSYGGQYTLKNKDGYKEFRGIMTWSINWDNTQNNEFAKLYRQYFDAMGGQRLPNN